MLNCSTQLPIRKRLKKKTAFYPQIERNAKCFEATKRQKSQSLTIVEQPPAYWHSRTDDPKH